MKTLALLLSLTVIVPDSMTLMAATASSGPAQSLEAGFARPPDATKPWCYWYWISDNISKDGITRDLEAMARVGIGEAFIGNIFLEDVPAGNVKVLSPEWWSLVEHAIREGGRTGVNIGLFNCPGWSQSGGPWIQPTETMRYLVASETRFRGRSGFPASCRRPRNRSRTSPCSRSPRRRTTPIRSPPGRRR